MLRILAKDLDNQIIITSYGAIDPLVKLLCSSDMNTQENAVTTVLNLSISNNNKTGTPEDQDNAAATLYSLSVFEENKIRIGNSGAIDALVELLGMEHPVVGRMRPLLCSTCLHIRIIDTFSYATFSYLVHVRNLKSQRKG
uniref:Uncharacterized protein n=1 Tax=Chenopodium quinoa TaxID=63459 RepID=A0A803NAR1_CHEQI